jgi:hypothetical protein
MSETREVETAGGVVRPDERWGVRKLLVLRILFCYFALYSVDVMVFTVQTLWGAHNVGYRTPWLTGYVWAWLVPWVGQHVLEMKRVAVMNIGADVPFEFMLRGVEVAIAVVAGVVWTALRRTERSRTERNDRRLYAWLRVGVRMALAGVMLRYGLAKLIPLQFGTLTLHRMARPLGELGPMGMLWAFMAASKGYTILCGAVEVAGGVLLLLPEVWVLGAAVSAGAMANVFVLNVFYDVNQKMRSLNYLLLAVFLLAPYIGRLLDVLVWNRRSDAVEGSEVARGRWARLAVGVLPVVYGVVLMSVMATQEVRAYTAERQQAEARDANFGVWRAVSFTVADPAKPLLTAKLSAELKPDGEQYRWRRLIFDTGHVAQFQFSSGEWDWEHSETSASAAGDGTETILTDSGDASWRCVLVLVPMPGNRMRMSGTINGNGVQAVFEREDVEGAYHLTDPLHWMARGDRDY